MLLMRMLMMCLAMIVSCSVASAQVGPGGPEGPGGLDPCFACSGIAEALATQQAAYDAVDADIQLLQDEFTLLHETLAEILASNLPPAQKTEAINITQAAIEALEDLIDEYEADLDEIAASIHALWDSWFALGCDNL